MRSRPGPRPTPQPRPRPNTKKPLTGTCRVRICAGQISRQSIAHCTNGDRALHGKGAVSISPISPRGRRSRDQRGRSPSNQPLIHHADRATLGRRRRPRRPELTELRDRSRGRCASIRLHNSFPTRFSRRCCPRVPPQTMFGSETRGLPGGKWIPESFETARPIEAVDSFSPGPRFRSNSRRASQKAGVATT